MTTNSVTGGYNGFSYVQTSVLSEHRYALFNTDVSWSVALKNPGDQDFDRLDAAWLKLPETNRVLNFMMSKHAATQILIHPETQ